MCSLGHLEEELEAGGGAKCLWWHHGLQTHLQCEASVTPIKAPAENPLRGSLKSHLSHTTSIPIKGISKYLESDSPNRIWQNNPE